MPKQTKWGALNKAGFKLLQFLRMCRLRLQIVLHDIGVNDVIWEMFLLKAVKKKAVI